MSFAKEFTHDLRDHPVMLRFQANMYNILNITQLAPVTNDSNSSLIQSAYFGQAVTADAGRIIELLARFQF